jgi:AcrR family transcriptional regulator
VSQQRVKVTARKRLLDAAIDAAARNGYAGTTVAEVLDRAGASRSTFYEHFADRDACLLAAAEEISDRLRTRVEQRASREQPQRIPLALAEAVLEFAREEEAQACLLFTELLAGGPRAMDLRDGLIDGLAALVEDAWHRGAGQAPTHDLPARALVGGIFRLLSFRMRRGASGVHGLQPAVLTWIDSYALNEGPPQWQSVAALEAPQPYAGAPVEPIAPPRPLPKGRLGLSAGEVARNHRDRLLHATAASVEEDGYAAVTVSDIVRGAQVSRSVFYRHFRDKRAAVIETLQLAFEMSMARCAGAFFAESRWPEQLWAGTRALSDHYLATPTLVYLGFVESYAAGSTSIEVVELRLRAFSLLLEQGYHHRPEAKELPPEISEIVSSATFELAYREVRQGRPQQPSHLLAQLAYLNLAPFMGARDGTSFVHAKMSELGIQAAA